MKTIKNEAISNKNLKFTFSKSIRKERLIKLSEIIMRNTIVNEV